MKKYLNEGDIFELKVKDDLFVYFQYISKDIPQLGSDCIRFFNYRSSSKFKGDDLSIISNSGTWFYSHTWIRRGQYHKLGNEALPSSKEIGSTYFFSILDDYPGSTSQKYIIRRINQEFTEAEVSEALFHKLKQSSWLDGVMGGPIAFIERINLKLENSEYEYLY